MDSIRFVRTISDKARKLLEIGEVVECGGTIRKKNGQIFEHFKFVEECVKESGDDVFYELQKMRKEATKSSERVIEELKVVNKKFENGTDVLNSLKNNVELGNVINGINLLVGSLNLCVTVAGFALTLNKLKKIDYKLNNIENGINQLNNSKIIDFKNKINEDISNTLLILDRYNRFKGEKFTGADYENIVKHMNRLEKDIKNLIERQYANTIKLNFESIISIYCCYLELNKLTLQKLSEINNLEGFMNEKKLIELNALIKEKVINPMLYKEMVLNIESIFTEKEIEDAIKLVCNLCDYNIKYLIVQNQMLVEAQRESFNVINTIKNKFYLNKRKVYLDE